MSLGDRKNKQKVVNLGSNPPPRSDVTDQPQPFHPLFGVDKFHGGIIPGSAGLSPTVGLDSPIYNPSIEQFAQFLHWNNSIIYGILEVILALP